jgi:hypothetical protein
MHIHLDKFDRALTSEPLACRLVGNYPSSALVVIIYCFVLKMRRGLPTGANRDALITCGTVPNFSPDLMARSHSRLTFRMINIYNVLVPLIVLTKPQEIRINVISVLK